MFQEYEFIEEPTPELIKSIQDQTADPNVYADWLLLFDDFNKAGLIRSDGQPYKIGFMCKPCYTTAYNWYKSRERSRLDEDQP